MQSFEYQTKHDLLRSLFDTGVQHVKASECLAAHLPKGPISGRTLVLGAGKAAAEMASVVSEFYGGSVEGLVVTRYGHGVCQSIAGIEVVEAGHPVPDVTSQKSAERFMDLANELREGDRLIFLVSGGASSLVSLPASGFSFSDKQALMKHLLHCGASISEINCVRKHVSRIKGGRLGIMAGKADIHTFVISDVPNDDVSDVGSGPTVLDCSSLEDARAVIKRYGAPDEALLLSLLHNQDNETPKRVPGNWHTTLVATAQDCFQAVVSRASEVGLKTMFLGADLEGDAAALGRRHGELAKSLWQDGENILILSGGETTVTVTNPNGCGGRNMEYALGLAIELAGHEGIFGLACDTDGIDGSEQAAGAIIDPTSLRRANQLGKDGETCLSSNCSYEFFEALGDLVVTGPTLTNVNDFRAILVYPNGDFPT